MKSAEIKTVISLAWRTAIVLGMVGTILYLTGCGETQPMFDPNITQATNVAPMSQTESNFAGVIEGASDYDPYHPNQVFGYVSDPLRVGIFEVVETEGIISYARLKQPSVLCDPPDASQRIYPCGAVDHIGLTLGLDQTNIGNLKDRLFVVNQTTTPHPLFDSGEQGRFIPEREAGREVGPGAIFITSAILDDFDAFVKIAHEFGHYLSNLGYLNSINQGIYYEATYTTEDGSSCVIFQNDDFLTCKSSPDGLGSICTRTYTQEGEADITAGILAQNHSSCALSGSNTACTDGAYNLEYIQSDIQGIMPRLEAKAYSYAIRTYFATHPEAANLWIHDVMTGNMPGRNAAMITAAGLSHLHPVEAYNILGSYLEAKEQYSTLTSNNETFQTSSSIQEMCN